MYESCKIRVVLDQGVLALSQKGPVVWVVFETMELFKIQPRIKQRTANGGVCKIQGGLRGPN